MSKYAVSGSNSVLLDASIDATSAVVANPSSQYGGENVLGRAITTGRIFWLRSFWAYNSAVINTLDIHDGSVGTVQTGALIRAKIRCASGNTTMVEFPKPGLKFVTGCVVSKEASAGGTAAFQPGDVGGCGYEEG